ncbi:MAG: RNA polymerase sigma factor [Anaerolineales bacterium]|nr:RNA polymerase sigma factor [Anaerolineales bacterium]
MKHKKPVWLDGARVLEPQAVEAMYAELSPELYRYAYRLTGHAEDSEDILAEAFIRLLRTLQTTERPISSIRAYLFRVVHNLAVDRFRSGKWIDPDADVSLLQTGTDPADGMENALASEQVRAALWQLTDEQRQVILLRFVQELSYEEIADVLQKPTGAVKALRQRGIEALRRIFKQQEKKREHNG